MAFPICWQICRWQPVALWAGAREHPLQAELAACLASVRASAEPEYPLQARPCEYHGSHSNCDHATQYASDDGSSISTALGGLRWRCSCCRRYRYPHSLVGGWTNEHWGARSALPLTNIAFTCGFHFTPARPLRPPNQQTRTVPAAVRATRL